jgi:hypothetical protein
MYRTFNTDTETYHNYLTLDFTSLFLCSCMLYTTIQRRQTSLAIMARDKGHFKSFKN